jgi:hypothetical protein
VERLATIIVVLFACCAIGVGTIYMSTHDPSWTFKWQEIFKDLFFALVGVYVPLTIPKWKILREVSHIFAGWYLFDLGFEVTHIGINEMNMPMVSDVGTFLFYVMSFSFGLLFATFTKTKTWTNIIKRF